MYFIMEGFIGIGFSMAGYTHSKSNIHFGKKQAGRQLICDNYVLNK